MSDNKTVKGATEWLMSHNKYQSSGHDPALKSLMQQPHDHEAQVISVLSGKGGVGKTSVAIKLAKMLAHQGKRTLLIDCDYNLSNTAVKLGLPLNDNFEKFYSGKIPFQNCIYKDQNFHLLTGCNGSLELFDGDIKADMVFSEIIRLVSDRYDYIVLDSPAGLASPILNLNANSHYRFFVVTPDRSSLTDCYSLIKVLKQRYGINHNHVIFNKVSSTLQMRRMVKSLGETVEKFLNGSIKVLGSVDHYQGDVDTFDSVFLGDENSSMHQNFIKVINTFTEERGRLEHKTAPVMGMFHAPAASFVTRDDLEQKVQLF